MHLHHHNTRGNKLIVPNVNTQPWELGKKYDGNFIFTFTDVKAGHGGITMAKIFKQGNYLK